jgi:hypothetical protein
MSPRHLRARRRPDVPVARTIDRVGWGLFLVWVGVAILADVGWAVGLIGVGLITLGAQARRRFLGLALETFWVVVGIVLVIAGVLDLVDAPGALVPVLCIVAGAALVVSALAGRSRA